MNEELDDDNHLWESLYNQPLAIRKWNQFLIKGNERYQRMVDTFDAAFDTSGQIVDFRIYHAYDATFLETEELLIDGIKDKIHKLLIPWIHEEHSSGRLFQQTDWKPFRDPYDEPYMYYGYRKLFVYEKYYLQLAVDDWGIRQEDQTIKQTVTFHLRLYGWKNEDASYVEHYSRVIVNESTLRMPLRDWNKK